ncbi:hypothetical protein ACWD11_22660 [Streptomyces sp. NPDC002776]
MTDIRPIPTPADLARRRPAPAPALAPVLAVTPFDRNAWEEAVLAGGLDAAARALAFTLAEHADTSGHIIKGSRVPADGLRAEAGLSQEQAVRAFEALHQARLIARPSRHAWGRGRGRRPITLIIPAAAAARTEPPHTGEAS